MGAVDIKTIVISYIYNNLQFMITTEMLVWRGVVWLDAVCSGNMRRGTVRLGMVGYKFPKN